MKNKPKSTFEKVMSDSKQKKVFEKEYANFLLFELLLNAMTEQDISIRVLPKAPGILTSWFKSFVHAADNHYTLKTLNTLLSSFGHEPVLLYSSSMALLRIDRDYLNPVFFEYLVCSDYVQQQINDSKVQVAQANLFQGKIKASIADTQKLLDYTMDKYFG